MLLLLQGLLVESVLEVGFEGANGVGAEEERTLCGGFEPGVGVGLGETQNAQARTVALLGMTSCLEDLCDEGGGGGSDSLGPSGESLRRPLLGEAAVLLGHVFGHRGMASLERFIPARAGNRPSWQTA